MTFRGLVLLFLMKHSGSTEYCQNFAPGAASTSVTPPHLRWQNGDCWDCGKLATALRPPSRDLSDLFSLDLSYWGCAD